LYKMKGFFILFGKHQKKRKQELDVGRVTANGGVLMH